jgi:hypothetical protein
VRRRERLKGTPIRSESLSIAEKIPQPSLGEAPARSLRFDDRELQARFTAELRKSALPFDLGSDGAVICTDADSPSLIAVANAIRDSCFRWYLSWWKTAEPAHRFWREMEASGLPFQVEHHDGQIVFLLPKGSEDLHEAITKRVQETALSEASVGEEHKGP